MKETSASDHARKLENLRKLLSEGDASGEPAPFDMEDFIAEKKKESTSGGRHKS